MVMLKGDSGTLDPQYFCSLDPEPDPHNTNIKDQDSDLKIPGSYPV